ncbi:MAG: zinc ribbon protein [Solirubrobacterales bacterium]|nr:zinc ribbon protein [Solirubrobacterales bacterium]
MTGRLSKLRRRRDATAQPGPADPAGIAATGSTADAPTAVQPPAAPLFADAHQPVPASGAPLPADVDPATQTAPSFRDRGRFRRRLRYLRRVRELGFRDLGGLVFDLHRFQRTGDDIVHAKLVALDAVDRELRALERVLQDERVFTDLREPGIAACARCGALHGSDARFCPSCGINLGGPTTLSELPVAITAAQAPTATDTTQAIPVASPIMPIAEPEPQPQAEPELEPEPQPQAKPEPDPDVQAAEPGPDAEAEAEGTPMTGAAPQPTPVTAAALGLPVPTPPPVPPLPPAAEPEDQPTAVLPKVDATDAKR